MRICPICQQVYESAEVRFCLADGQPLVERTSPVAQPPPAAAQPTGVPFSASLAMTFFAHRFIENVPPETGDFPLCQPNVEVSSWQLVTHLPVIAFWYLRENNCIRFTPAVKNSRTLVIEANPAAQAHFPGLEYDFFEIIKCSPPGVTTQTIFKQFIGWVAGYPEDNLIKRLVAWMIQLGYGQPDTSPKPFIRFGRVPLFDEFVPDCRRIMAHEQAAQIIHNRWMKFRAEQPDFYYYLFDEVVSGALTRGFGERIMHGTYYYHAQTYRRYGKT